MLFNAQKISDFLDYSQEMTEPPMTLDFSLEHLQNQAENGNILQFPEIPCHTQSIERTIKIVTKVSKKVKSYRRRHKEILCLLFHRKFNASDNPDSDTDESDTDT